MIEPRDPDTIIREINDLNQVILQSEQLLKKFADDELMQLASMQDQHRKKKLAKELHLSLSLYLYQFG